MFSFEIVPKISQYDDFAAFAESHALSAQDLIVTNQWIYDPFIKPLGLPCPVIYQEQFGVGEPSDRMIDLIKAAADRQDAGRIVAVGGGTVIDIAKVLVLEGQWTTADLFERKVPVKKARQLLIVPTTCGTGSEVTSITIAEMTAKKTKLGLNVRELYADEAVLIPAMLSTLPYKVFATSSIDALIHAVESYVSPKANPFSKTLGRQAMEMILRGYRRIQGEGQDVWMQDAADYLLASNYAGIAFNSAGVAAVHALSYPLGGTYHIAHGEANHLMFTEVFKTYHAKQPVGRINELEALLSGMLGCAEAAVWDEMETLLDSVLHKRPLREYHIDDQDFPAIADGVIAQQQRLLVNNYVPLTAAEMVRIYQSLY